MSSSRRYSSVYKTSSRSNRGNSRLLKKQEKEMRKQTFFFIFLAIVLLLLFIFVIMPNLIKLFFNFIDNDSGTNINNDLPPQAPVLFEAPPEATFSAQLKLQGYADPDSRVVFILNGQQVEEELVGEKGEFNKQLQLEKGDNKLTLYAVNELGTESLQSKTYQLVYDDEPPVITLIEPKPDSTIELKRNRNTSVVGETEPSSRVYLNDLLILADENGQFTSTYYLEEGDNLLRFVAVDRAGNQSELEIKVKFLNN